jgi:hypothetical protein
VGRKITGENSQYELREPQNPYHPLFMLVYYIPICTPN